MVQAIGDGRRGGLVDQAQHIQARHLRSVFGGLALGVVKIGWHGNHHAIQVVVESVFGAVTQCGQNFGAHLDGGFVACHRTHGHHAGGIDQRIRQLLGIGHIGQFAPHEPLDRADGVGRITGLRGQSLVPNLAPTALPWGQITHHAGHNHLALFVGQTLGHAMAHRRYQRVRGAQVDTHRNAPLVRVGRLAGFRNLQ